MNEKIAFLLNQQINKELYSAYLYLDMSNYYDDLDLDGFANYYMIQAQEERDHAMLFLKYMQEVGLKVTLEAIDKPDKEFKDPIDPLVIAAEHERYVTALINDIYHECYENRDYRTMKFLDWFVDEQREEEDNADSMISRYKLFGGDPSFGDTVWYDETQDLTILQYRANNDGVGFVNTVYITYQSGRVNHP